MNGYFRGTPIFETFIKVAPAKSDSWKWLMANLSDFSVFFWYFLVLYWEIIQNQLVPCKGY